MTENTLPAIDTPRYQIKIRLCETGARISTLDLPTTWGEEDARAVFPQFAKCAAVTAKAPVRVALYH